MSKNNISKLKVTCILKLNGQVVGFTVINNSDCTVIIERITSKDCKITDKVDLKPGDTINLSIAELYNNTMCNGILNGELKCKKQHTSESSTFEKLSDFEFKASGTEDNMSIITLKDIIGEETPEAIDKYFVK